jgi:hypothetical protein
VVTGRIVVGVASVALLEAVLAGLERLGVAGVSGPREADPLVLVVTPAPGQDPDVVVGQCRELTGVDYAELETLYETFE